MENVNLKQGIVGFFDVLGYSSFLENNDAEDAAEILVNFFSKVDQVVPEISAEIHSHAKEEFIAPTSRIEWLIFSDTVLLVLPWEEQEVDQHRFNEWVSFTSAARVLSRIMFDNGLPLRGAISTGAIILEGNCFAGKPIIEAYKLAHKLDLAACAFTPHASKDMHDLFNENGYGWKHICHEYLTPLKGGQSEKLSILAPTPCPMPFVGDIPQIVSEAFWGNSKDIPPDAYNKLRNTIQFFRFSKMHHEHTFLDSMPEVIDSEDEDET